MSSLQDDIIKYRNGQLSSKEMHLLEKRAMKDPFLADALEGAENISSKNLTEDIAELNQRILGKRKTVLFTPLRIAAGVILIAASIIGLYQLMPETNTIALTNEKPSAPSADSSKEQPDQPKQEEKIATDKKHDQPKAIKSPVEGKKPLANQPVHQTAQTKMPANEISKSEGERPTDTNIAQTLSAPEAKAEDAKVEFKEAVSELAEKKSEEANTQTKDAPVSIASQPAQGLAANEGAGRKTRTKRLRKAKYAEEANAVASGGEAASPRRITGKVTSAEDGTPLIGVNVVVAGTTIGTATDTEGNFSLSSPGENQKLIFSFIGLETREENTKGKTNIDVALKQDASQLSEIVVSAVGEKRDDDAEPIVHSASPVGGLRAYNKYLNTNVRYPQEALKNNVKGKVKVEFSVNTDGSLDEYKVVKGLGFGCDEEVIRLIKDGPKWSPSTENGRPVESTVLVGVKFDPAKSGR